MPYIVQAPQASAAVNYDHNALLEYKGYGEAMYETIVDQTTFISGQYTENKQYVKDSIGQIKDYANFWLKEQGSLKDACGGFQIFSKNCLGEMVSSGAGYALTVGDFIKNLFNDAANSDDFNEPIDDPYKNIVFKSANSAYITLASGYCIKFTSSNSCYTEVSPIYTFTNNFYGMALHFGDSTETNGSSVSKTQEENVEKSKTYNQFMEVEGISRLSSFLSVFGVSYSIIKKADNSEIPSRNPNNNYKSINNYVQDSSNPIKTVVPQPKAYLNCPDGTRIDMAINGSTFLDASGQVMNVNTDGMAQVSSQICNLGWEKQKVDYVDDKPAITDPDGNWMDIVTGELLECVLLEKCEVTKPPAEVEPIDNTLLEYVKNAYEYATSALKTATDGLKSLGEGAKDLTALFGIFFSWLPKEVVVLMTSGLMLTIGLRLFRK